MASTVEIREISSPRIGPTLGQGSKRIMEMLRQLTREHPAGRVGKTRADRMECSGVGTTRSENRASAWNRMVLKVLFFDS